MREETGKSKHKGRDGEYKKRGEDTRKNKTKQNNGSTNGGEVKVNAEKKERVCVCPRAQQRGEGGTRNSGKEL